MTTKQRRERIRQILSEATGPVSASALAAQLGVSRQIVVGDIALLRASGQEIDATPRGYLQREHLVGCRGMAACCHSTLEQLRAELYCVVDNGGTLEDVIVENPLYGEITGHLHITSRYDADVFLEKVGEEPASLLSCLTGGVHLHTLLCPDEVALERIRAALTEQGLTYEK